MILRLKGRFVFFISLAIFFSLLFFPQKQLQARRIAGYLSEAEVAAQVAEHRSLFQANAGALPLELAQVVTEDPIISAIEGISEEASNLLLLPYYVDNRFEDVVPDKRDRIVIGIVYSMAYLRQFSNGEAAEILREISENTESAALVELLSENYDYKGSDNLLTEQLKAIGDYLSQPFTDDKPQKIAEIIRTRDKIVNTSRALRIGFEALNYQNSNLSGGILRAIADTPEIIQVVSGLRVAAIIGKDEFSGDIAELKEVLWAMRQAQGEIINILEVGGKLYVYNEYKVREAAMRAALQGSFDDMIAVTRTGLEHLIKKDIIGDTDGLFSNLAKVESEDSKANFVKIIAPAILAADSSQSYTYFDPKENIYRASGLAGQVIELEKQVPDAVYIATKDRVTALNHQLQAELENYRIFNHYAPIVVIDNTKKGQLEDNKTNIENLIRVYGSEIIHVASGADVEDTSKLVEEYAAKLKEEYQEFLGQGKLDSRVKAILDDKGIIVDGEIDENALKDYLNGNMFKHISGVRNHMLLLAAIRGDKIIMNMDDDAPAETYISLNREDYNQERQEKFDKAINGLIGEAKAVGINISTTDNIYQQIDELYQQWNDDDQRFRKLERKYFSFVAEDETQGLLPQAMEEIKRLQDQYLAAAQEMGINMTHMRYQSLMEPLADLMVRISDFAYEDGRKNKDTGGFMILPVNTFSQYSLLNQTVRDTDLMVFKDDLRGTMAVPGTKEELKAMLDKKILYVAYPFIGDQDTSALAQLVAYLSGNNLSSVELQHTHRSAFLNEGVTGFVGDTYIIFNRGMFSTEVIFPSIGRELRLEEPPYVKWIVNPIMNDGILSAFATVGGGQLRIIGERAYVIAGQDFTEVVGGVARSFYEAAVENFRQSNPKGDFMERLRELGREFINITSNLTLSEKQQVSLLEQREIRAQLMVELGIRRGIKEQELNVFKEQAGIIPSENEAEEIAKREQEIRDIDGALVEWANSFYLSRYSKVETAPGSKIYISTPKSDEDYFYKVWSDGEFLHWQKITPILTIEDKNGVNVVTNSEWKVLGGGVKELSSWEEGQLLEIEQGRWIAINNGIDQLLSEEHKAIVPALVGALKDDYLKKVIDDIVSSIRSDGETMVLWPDVLDIAKGMEADGLFAKLFGI
jgi:hypothetical protein